MAKLFEELELDTTELASFTGYEVEELSFIDNINNLEYDDIDVEIEDKTPAEKENYTIKLSKAEYLYIKTLADDRNMKVQQLIISLIEQEKGD